MDTKDFEEYLEKRYYDQLKYYSKASGKNQKKYKNFQWILIILSTLTTILAALPRDYFDMQYVVVVTAGLVAILTSGLKTFQYQELWVNYRSTIEQLKPEIYYYKFNVGDYGQEGIDKESTFVFRVEQILNKEHDVWPVYKKLKDNTNQDQDLHDEVQKILEQRLAQRFNKQETGQPADTTVTEQPEETMETEQMEETANTGQPEETPETQQPDIPVEKTDR